MTFPIGINKPRMLIDPGILLSNSWEKHQHCHFEAIFKYNHSRK